MSPDVFVRLASDQNFRAGVERAPHDVLASQAPSMLQQRLAQLAARRLVRLELPQRSYLWWNSGESVRPARCLG